MRYAKLQIPKLQTLACVSLGILLGSTWAAAQRAPSAAYDTGRKVSLKGPVTRLEWTTPHAFLFVDVKDATGTIANWAVDIGNPLDLEKSNWRPSAIKIGDIVTVEGTPTRDTSRQAQASSVVLARSGGKLFTLSAAAAPAKGKNPPAPRWPNGHVRLGPEPGKKGYWAQPSATWLMETGVNVPVNADGLLNNIADADKVAPFQPWAKAIYEYRQRSLFKDDPYNRCMPPGGVRHFQSPQGVQFIEQPEVGRVLLLLGGGNRNWRIIYTDGRPMGNNEDLVLAYYGTSAGRWEGDTLVVDTVGFNEKFWFTNGGLPHTGSLHLTERFTRTDLNTLQYQVTVDDPLTYTRPWSGGWTLRWIPDQEIQQYFCEENAESTFVR